MRGRGAGVSGISGGMNTSTAGARNAIGTSTTTTSRRFRLPRRMVSQEALKANWLTSFVNPCGEEPASEGFYILVTM